MDIGERLDFIAALNAMPDLPASTIRVGTALACRLNGGNGRLNPSIATLAKDAGGITGRGVNKALTVLERLGAIRIRRSRGGGRNDTNQYTLVPFSSWRKRPPWTDGIPLNWRSPLNESSPVTPEPQFTLPLNHSSRTPEPQFTQTQERTQEENTRTSPKFSTTDFSLAKHQYQQLLELNPSHKKPNLEKWAAVFRLMRERDGRTETEIREMLAWVNRDKFWSGNILSPDKLRKHWDRLVIQRSRNDQASAAGPDLRGAI